MDRRNELKRAYKETPRPMGVYQILNKANGKRWLNASMDLHGAGNSAFFQLRLGSHPNKALQEDWRRYGEESFVFELLDQLKPDEDPARNLREDLEALLGLWLDKLQPYGEQGYNHPKRN